MTNRDELLTPEEIARIRAPIESARTLPRRAFTSEAFFERERRRVAERNWLAVCFEAEVAHPGDAVPVELWGVPVAVVRDPAGEVRAFHNVCAYDGCPVLDAPVLAASDLVAPYHGWRYALDGRLLDAPFWAGPPGDGSGAVPSDFRRLHEIPARVAFGIVFCDPFPSQDRPAFEEHVAPLAEILEEFDLDRLGAAPGDDGRVEVFESVVAGNWKTFVENDCVNVLHESFTHEMYRASPNVPRVTAQGTARFKAEIDRDLIGFSYLEADATDTYPVLDLPHIGKGTPPMRGLFVQLHPNLSIAAMSTLLAPIIQFPEAAGRTRLRGATFVHRDATGPQFAQSRRAADELFADAAAEDAEVIEAIQRNRCSPARDQGFFSPFWDRPHHAFTKRVVDDLVQDEA